MTWIMGVVSPFKISIFKNQLRNQFQTHNVLEETKNKKFVVNSNF